MIPELILLAFSVLPISPVLIDNVDIIEINHFYDEQGRLVFDQAIFYDWSESATRYQIRAWRLIKHKDQLPQYDWSKRLYSAVWLDGDHLRHVTAQSVRETWTQFDPELLEREHLQKEYRRELSIYDRKEHKPQPLRPTEVILR